MAYKPESKPARTLEQVQQDNYLFRKSEASVVAFRRLLADTRDLSETYEAFRKRFEVLKEDREKLDKQDSCIVARAVSSDYYKALHEKVSLGTRLERAEQFSFRGKIFHIHGGSMIIRYDSVEIDPELKELVCEHEVDLRVAIARRGGIIDDYDCDRSRLKYTDCCVMIDNEDWRYTNWKDKFSYAVNNYGLELITRFAVWYAITRTPELSGEERKALGDSSFYLDAVEARNTKVLETERIQKAEAEERARQNKIQEEKDFEEIMNLLRDKYSAEKVPLAQMKEEVQLGSFRALWSWSGVRRYIQEHYHMTAAVYFKQEGLIGTKRVERKKPEEPAPDPLPRLAASYRSLTVNNSLSSEDDDVDPDDWDFTFDDDWDLSDLNLNEDDLIEFEDKDDFEITYDEDDEDILEFKKDVEDTVEKLIREYSGKQQFDTYGSLKKTNPDIDWKDVEDTIKTFMRGKPASYFKEAGLVRSGGTKKQTIGKAEAEQKASSPEAESSVKQESEEKTVPVPEPAMEPGERIREKEEAGQQKEEETRKRAERRKKKREIKRRAKERARQEWMARNQDEGEEQRESTPEPDETPGLLWDDDEDEEDYF